MADVVRTGAIFRVKNPATMRSPMPRLPARGRLASATPETSRRPKSALEAVVTRAGAGPKRADKKTRQSEGAQVLAKFNRLVSDSRRAARVGGDGARMAPARGRKRPRRDPEPEPSDGEEEDEEEEEEEEIGEEEAVTPQHVRRRDAVAEEDDDSDGVTVQKRLMYDDTPPAKTKPSKENAQPRVQKDKPLPKQPTAAPKPKPRQKRVVAPGGGLELFSMTAASTPSRSTRIRTGVLIMSEWYLDWPPSFVGDQLQLVLHGQVLGHPATFTVQRRVTDTQFVSSDNQNVRLSGCLDIERARKADVPPMVMEILVEGIPTNWRQLLEIYAPPPDPRILLSAKSMEKARKKRAKAAGTAEAERKTSVPIPGVTKPPPRPKAISAAKIPATPSGEKRSRSGRTLTPVMEWWRNERKVVDANFATKIVEGSPAYLPSKREAVKSEAAQVARQKIQEIYNAQRKSAEWSDEQLAALQDAKVQVPTTDPNFWVEVAKRVPGKNAEECRARSYDDLPATRKTTAGGGSRATQGTKQKSQSQVPVKIHRAGTNLFKKQVRQFVRDQEQKNIDDLFSLETPSKAALAGTSGLDDLKSPGAPLNEQDCGADESDDDALLSRAGRELLEKVPLSKRDDVDSYVRTIKRANDALGMKAVRTSKASTTGFTTPQGRKKPRREGVQMVEEVGSHLLQGIVTPGGTTRVRVERGSDEDDTLNGDDDDEEAALSDAY